MTLVTSEKKLEISKYHVLPNLREVFFLIKLSKVENFHFKETFNNILYIVKSLCIQNGEKYHWDLFLKKM